MKVLVIYATTEGQARKISSFVAGAMTEWRLGGGAAPHPVDDHRTGRRY